MSASFHKCTIRDVDVAGKRVFLRVDYNVQVIDGEIIDDLRLRESVPTVQTLRERGARIVICSHRGRPRGEVVEMLRNAPLARRLSELLGVEVQTASDCVGPDVEAASKALDDGDVLLLENVRFHPGEETNDPDFAAQLARLGDIYVDDAFGTAHRAHASIVGVPKHLPAAAGLLLEREYDYLSSLSESPERPFALVLGGAKVSDKIAILDHLADQANLICAGGGIANTFLMAREVDVADSLWEGAALEGALRVMRRVHERKDLHLYLPVDAVVAFGAADPAHVRTVPIDQVPSGWRILDVGPATIELYRSALSEAKTIVWNGPLGWFEHEPFDRGTLAMARLLAELDAKVVVGGGETAAAVQRAGVADRITHISTGGGASLALLQGHSLPGIEALEDR